MTKRCGASLFFCNVAYKQTATQQAWLCCEMLLSSSAIWARGPRLVSHQPISRVMFLRSDAERGVGPRDLLLTIDLLVQASQVIVIACHLGEPRHKNNPTTCSNLFHRTQLSPLTRSWRPAKERHPGPLLPSSRSTCPGAAWNHRSPRGHVPHMGRGARAVARVKRRFGVARGHWKPRSLPCAQDQSGSFQRGS